MPGQVLTGRKRSSSPSRVLRNLNELLPLSLYIPSIPSISLKLLKMVIEMKHFLTNEVLFPLLVSSHHHFQMRMNAEGRGIKSQYNFCKNDNWVVIKPDITISSLSREIMRSNNKAPEQGWCHTDTTKLLINALFFRVIHTGKGTLGSR